MFIKMVSTPKCIKMPPLTLRPVFRASYINFIIDFVVYLVNYWLHAYYFVGCTFTRLYNAPCCALPVMSHVISWSVVTVPAFSGFKLLTEDTFFTVACASTWPGRVDMMLRVFLSMDLPLCVVVLASKKNVLNAATDSACWVVKIIAILYI